MTLLHTMSLTGSAATVVYLLSCFWTKRHMSVLWHKVYLIINILLFLVPLARFKSEYIEVLNKYFCHEAWFQKNDAIQNMLHYTVFVYPSGVYVSNAPTYLLIFVSILLGTGGLVIFMRRYFIVYGQMMKGVEWYKQGETVVKQLEKERKRSVNAKVYLCAGLKSSITIGLLHGSIILPKSVWKQNRLEDVLRHELGHIRAKDNIMKVILAVVVLLNFYNLLVYYLLYRWNMTAELYCDNQVIADKSIEETGEYILFLIHTAEIQEGGKIPITGLNMSRKQLKERIAYMKRMKKTGNKYGIMSKAMGMLILAAAVFASSLTVCAYEERHIWYLDRPYEKVDASIWYDNWEQDGRTELDVKYDAYEDYVNAGDVIFFVSDEGEVYYDVHTDADQMYRSCSHTYVSGTVVNHEKDGKGGCKMDYYAGQRCTRCGHEFYGDLVRTVSYTVCPH